MLPGVWMGWEVSVCVSPPSHRALVKSDARPYIIRQGSESGCVWGWGVSSCPLQPLSVGTEEMLSH